MTQEREAIVRRMLGELRFGYGNEQTLRDVLCDGAEPDPNDDSSAASYEAQEAIINAILALRTPSQDYEAGVRAAVKEAYLAESLPSFPILKEHADAFRYGKDCAAAAILNLLPTQPNTKDGEGA